MSLPPLNLLLPHIHTFKDDFTEYPLHITSTTPAAVLTLLFLHHATQRVNQHQESGVLGRSILINCNGSKETFLESLVSDESALSQFFRGRSTKKGKFLYAASRVSVMHVTTLHELRALLCLLSMEESSTIDEEGEEDDVPDSQGSQDDELGSEERIRLPILALSGLDSLLREAGELSAQGLLKILTSAIDAVEGMYHLVIHDSIPVDAEIDIVNDPSRVPESMADVSTTFRKCYARYIACDWVVSGYGQSQGQWQHLDGLGYKVFWQQNSDGECVDSRMEKVR